jgi:hypothetical protein
MNAQYDVNMQKIINQRNTRLNAQEQKSFLYQRLGEL